MERKSELTPFCGAAAAFCLMFIAAATKWKTVRGRKGAIIWMTILTAYSFARLDVFYYLDC